MGDLSLFLRVGLALVFLAAASGKMLGDRSLSDLSVATVEAGLSVMIVMGAYPAPVALMAAIVCMTYLGHALVSADDRCQCFGPRLPSTSRVWQRARNALLMASSIAYLVIVVERSSSPASIPTIDIGLAVTAAVALIALPWLIDWTAESESAIGLRSNQ